MPIIVIKMCDLCPEGAGISAIAASVAKWAYARFACSNNVMVSSEGVATPNTVLRGVLG